MLQFAGAANLPICNKTFQKYIALHVKTVPVEFVYACIGNDYSFIKMKQVPTHNGIDVNTFLFICENGLNRTFGAKDQFPVLESFVAKHLPPRPVNEQVSRHSPARINGRIEPFIWRYRSRMNQSFTM